MTYTEQEKQEFARNYFPTSFVYNNSMSGRYNDNHVRAYVNWASYAMDIVYERWYSYRSVKGDLDQAEETYNKMMGADLEFLEEETWNSLRESVIDSLQLAKAHNLHMMTFGKSGSCVAADGRAEWGTDCLFPNDMEEVIALMPHRTTILIEGGKIFGQFGKKVEAVISKVISPEFRYNRAKKEAIEDAKRQAEYQHQQEIITNLKNESQLLASQQAEAWEKIHDGKTTKEDAEQLRILYQQLEERKKQMEAEAQQAGIVLGMMKDKNSEQKKQELPRNFQDLYQNDEEFALNSEITSTSQDSSDIIPNKFPIKETILGGIIFLFVGGFIYLSKYLLTNL